jgi:hypothetical protein
VRETAALPPWGGGVIHTPYTSNKASASWGRHHWYSRGYGYRSLITAGKPAVAPSLGCVCLRPRPAPVCPPDCRRCIPRHPQRWWRVSPTASGGLPSWQCRSTAHPTGHRVHADDESNTWRRSDNAHPRRATNDSRCLCRRSTAVQWPGYAYLPPRPLPRAGMGGIRADARIRCAGPRRHQHGADLTAQTRPMPMPTSKLQPDIWRHPAIQDALRIPAVTWLVVHLGDPPHHCSAEHICLVVQFELEKDLAPL